jgi:putative SOS response-associated peptidase YedK
MHRPINARVENLGEKPMFRDLLRTKRCLIPASGFFEWKEEWGRRIPFYIHLKNDPVFAFAGLYDVWHNPAGTTLATYTIITIPANSTVAPVHNRMPAILRQEDEIRWVSHDTFTGDEMQRVFSPYPPELMEAYPVSDRVNNTRDDDERVIEPLRGL